MSKRIRMALLAMGMVGTQLVSGSSASATAYCAGNRHYHGNVLHYVRSEHYYSNHNYKRVYWLYSYDTGDSYPYTDKWCRW